MGALSPGISFSLWWTQFLIELFRHNGASETSWKGARAAERGGMEKHHYFEHLSGPPNAGRQRRVNIFPLEWWKLVLAKSEALHAATQPQTSPNNVWQSAVHCQAYSQELSSVCPAPPQAMTIATKLLFFKELFPYNRLECFSSCPQNIFN